MICISSDIGETGGFVNCKAEGEFRVWCPTWFNAQKGPSHFCRAHSDVFRPEVNTNAKDGHFFWGDEATEAFQSVEEFFLRDDPRYSGIIGMLNNGTKISKRAFVVDGKLWFVASFGSIAHHVMRLGDYAEQKERFAKLIATDK